MSNGTTIAYSGFTGTAQLRRRPWFRGLFIQDQLRPECARPPHRRSSIARIRCLDFRRAICFIVVWPRFIWLSLLHPNNAGTLGCPCPHYTNAHRYIGHGRHRRKTRMDFGCSCLSLTARTLFVGDACEPRVLPGYCWNKSACRFSSDLNVGFLLHVACRSAMMRAASWSDAMRLTVHLSRMPSRSTSSMTPPWRCVKRSLNWRLIRSNPTCRSRNGYGCKCRICASTAPPR